MWETDLPIRILVTTPNTCPLPRFLGTLVPVVILLLRGLPQNSDFSVLQPLAIASLGLSLLCNIFKATGTDKDSFFVKSLSSSSSCPSCSIYLIIILLLLSVFHAVLSYVTGLCICAYLQMP